MLDSLHKLKCLFVFCSMELGGAERQGMHLARYLKNLGCDVRVLSHMGGGMVEQLCDEAGIPWSVQRFRWPCRKSSLIRDSWRLIKALRKESPDIILTYTTWPNVGCGLTWRWSHAKACIWSQRNINDLYGHLIERFAYRRISAVICNAQHQVSYLQNILGETPAPISVVHNGVELAPAIKTRHQWRKELGISEDTIVVTMIANFRLQKDHPTLLYAWSKVLTNLPQGSIRPRLVLAGAPQESYNSIRQLTTELELDDTVSFLNQVKDISGLLAASDIGILISKHEGLSNSILEYMASGLPVIATDLPGNHEALGDELEQFCKPGDVDDLAEKLSQLINNPELRQKLGTQNKLRAAQEFSVNKMCEKTVDIIKKLLPNGPLPSRTINNSTNPKIKGTQESKQCIKIAIVTGTLGIGGAELVILNLGSSLKNLGYDVTIVTTSMPGEWFDQIEKRGLKALHIDGRFNVHPYHHAWRVGRTLRDKKFDVIIMTKFTNSERATQAALNMLPDNVIAIPWIHSNTKDTYRTALTNKRAWNVAVGVGAKVAAKVAKKCKEKHVIHIPNGLTFPPAELLQSNRMSTTQPFHICFIGRMEQVSKGIFNLPIIMEVCLQKKFDIILDIIGDGPDQQELRYRFEEAGLINKVKFHNAVSHDEVFVHLCQAHALLMPSYYEAMPCVPIEAQYCGCVPIVSRLPGVTDTIIDDGKTGILVDVDDIDGFVNAVGILANNPDRWQAMSDAGHHRVAEFTIENMGKRFDELIQACLQGEYPLQHPRHKWLPINPLAFTWRETIPRSIHRLGIGKRTRELFGKYKSLCLSSNGRK